MKKSINPIKERKIKKALELLKARKITIRKAAKLADISYAEMLDFASKADIGIGYSLNIKIPLMYHKWFICSSILHGI